MDCTKNSTLLTKAKRNTRELIIVEFFRTLYFSPIANKGSCCCKQTSYRPLLRLLLLLCFSSVCIALFPFDSPPLTFYSLPINCNSLMLYTSNIETCGCSFLHTIYLKCIACSNLDYCLSFANIRINGV